MSATASPTTATAAATTTTAVGRDALPGDVLDNAQAALAAWGEFAATGELGVVDGSFVIGGPQYVQLEGEAPGLAETAEGPPPFEFLLTFPQVVAADGVGIATVRGTVVIARNGEIQSEVDWDIEMHWFDDEGRWRLFKATDSPPG